MLSARSCEEAPPPPFPGFSECREEWSAPEKQERPELVTAEPLSASCPASMSFDRATPGLIWGVLKFLKLLFLK